MLMASIRFSANPAKSAKATAKTPHTAVKRRATRTLRASSAAARGRKWRQKSIVVVVPSAARSMAFGDGAGVFGLDGAEATVGCVSPPFGLVEEDGVRHELVEDEQERAEQQDHELHRDLQDGVEDQAQPALPQRGAADVALHLRLV